MRITTRWSIVPVLSSLHVVRGWIYSESVPFRQSILRYTTTSVQSKKRSIQYHIEEPTKDANYQLEDINTDLLPFANSYHAPVMWRECISALMGCQRIQNDDNTRLVFVDGTLGGGGHSQALLEVARPNDLVFGCDVDPDALKTASERLSKYLKPNPNLPLFVPVQSNFCDLNTNLLSNMLRTTLDASNIDSSLYFDENNSDNLLADGILLDLGVSSYQIDTAERGFAFMKDGPLDMRMGRTGGLTAADICNEFDVSELRRIFSVYGDEPRAKQIANAIAERRPLKTTQDLHDAVSAVTPQFAKKGRRMGRTATLARVFQSLRIVVNREDVVLEKALTEMAPSLLRPGGRLVVLSYHSMEDRATKRVMRDGTVSKREAERRNQQKDIYGNYIGEAKPFRSLGKAQKATEEEVGLNSRARSATLRVAERTDTSN